MEKVRKTLIQIIFLCNDIDNLERTLLLLKQNSLTLSINNRIIIDVTMMISDNLFDWDKSIIKKDLFIDKFHHLKNYADWADEYYFNVDETSFGSCEPGIKNIYKYDVDEFIWLDVDIVFNNYTLETFLQTSNLVKDSTSKYVITSNLVKMWDESWNELQHPYFSNQPENYVLFNDSFKDVNIEYGELSIRPVKYFKFGGGWFTLFSKSILEYLEIPNTIRGFCPIDTWIMNTCQYIPDAKQFKIENLIVCEDRKYTKRDLYDKYIVKTNKNFDYYIKSNEELNAHFNSKILPKIKSKI